MTNVLYVPLDERACNYSFPQKLARMTDGIRLLVPPYGDMGRLKTPANLDKIWEWLFEKAPQCDYAILSVDTLVYGNIVNSRTHHRTSEECRSTLNRFRELKKRNPRLQIHAFNLVARVAAYDDAHEDPDYWAEQGRNIWRYTCLMDKISRGQADDAEKMERDELKAAIPPAILEDFLERRVVDRLTNLFCVDLVKDGVFDVLTIPKDDTAEYGYAAMDQSAIAKKVVEEGLMDRVLVYPGADEVGCVLFARVFNRIKGYTPRVYVRYSSTLGPTIVPKYEDRPLGESIKAQITSAGGIYEDNTDHADCMLAVNTPGKYMIESSEQYTKDISFTSHINMHEFLRYIAYFASQYKKAIGLAEVSVCNGCENEFMEYALRSGILEQVQSVGGWNTAQNTIGVVLAHTILASYYNRMENDRERLQRSEEFKLRSIVCDWLYQSNVLHRFLRETQGKIDPYALGEQYETVRSYFETHLRQMIDNKFGGRYKGAEVVIRNLSFNWDGVFYIDFDIGLDGLKLMA